jgi:hypothetical protein
MERSVATGERVIQQAERNLERQDKWERFWQERTKERKAGLFDRLSNNVRDTEAAHGKWTALEKAHGFDKAAQMILANPSLIGGRSGLRRSLTNDHSRKKAERSWRDVVRHRRKWQEAKLRFSDARSKVENARFALQRARTDYRHLISQVGSREEVRKYLLRSISLRASELDRVDRRAFRRSRLAEDRMAQLQRAWRLHESRQRKREREREQGGREFGM